MFRCGNRPRHHSRMFYSHTTRLLLQQIQRKGYSKRLCDPSVRLSNIWQHAESRVCLSFLTKTRICAVNHCLLIWYNEGRERHSFLFFNMGRLWTRWWVLFISGFLICGYLLIHACSPARAQAPDDKPTPFLYTTSIHTNTWPILKATSTLIYLVIGWGNYSVTYLYS